MRNEKSCNAFKFIDNNNLLIAFETYFEYSHTEEKRKSS